MTEAILDLRDVGRTFKSGGSQLRALDGVSLSVRRGECLAVVGESGSGKTTLANLILGVLQPSEGEILLDGETLPARRRPEHRRSIQLVQQDPLSSLNPKRTVGASVRLGLDVHRIGSRADRWKMVERALEEVGLPAEFRRRRPASLSGGQRQRVAIARALACQSRIVVLDEPTSALDVLVQARVLKLVSDLRARRGLTYVFITHDLSVVRNVADRVAVFRHGRLVECADTERIFQSPEQDYTRSLIGAVPVIAEEELALRRRLMEETAH